VNNSFLVRCFEGFDDLRRDRDRVIHGDWTASDPIRQRLAFH
jgi:hypothetical protein